MGASVVEVASITAQRQFLLHPDLGYTEIRAIRDKKVKVVFVDNDKDAEEFVQSVIDTHDVYVGVNPRTVKSGTSEDIGHVTSIVVDIDPVRPTGAPSSVAQHEQALALGRKIQETYKTSVLVDSGSGAHLYIPVEPAEVTDIEVATENLSRIHNKIKEEYRTEGLHIDSVFDLPRIMRVWGTHNFKSDRKCAPVDIVDCSKRIKLTFHANPVTTTSPDRTKTEERLFALAVTHPKLYKILNGQEAFDSRSEADFAFVAILHRAHFGVEEIKSLMVHNPLGRREEVRPKDVERIISKLDKFEDSTFSLTTGTDAYYGSLLNRKMGIDTGFPRLTEMISGWKPGKTYLFAARPTDGKTTLMTQLLTSCAQQGQVALFFPTEVGAEPIYDKILSARTGINLKKFQNGTFNSQELERLEVERPWLASLPIIVHEDFSLTVEKMEQKIKQINPDIIAVDFVQAMFFNDPGSPGEIAQTYKGIVELSRKYNKPVLAAAQLNRGDGLTLSRLKGSSAFEEYSDVVGFLTCLDNLTYPCPTDLVIMKSKYSETGPIPLNFWKSVSKFEEK